MPILSENFKMRPKHNWYSKLIRKYYKIRVNLIKPRNPIPDADILQKAASEKRLVIQIPFGGLGDHLVYSSLPELLWEQKGIKTFISNKSIFRSKAICDFIWGLNPYITFTDENGWFTYKPLVNNFPTVDGYFQNLFNLHGNGRPKVYYKPNLIEQLKGVAIIDVSFGPAGRANGYYEKSFHESFVDYIQKNVSEFVLITHNHAHTKKDFEQYLKRIFNPDCYNISTIEELADVLFSAEKRYLLHSGAASLSAGLNLESNILNYIKPSTYNHFKYSINNYIDLKNE